MEVHTEVPQSPPDDSYICDILRTMGYEDYVIDRAVLHKYDKDNALESCLDWINANLSEIERFKNLVTYTEAEP